MQDQATPDSKDEDPKRKELISQIARVIARHYKTFAVNAQRITSLITISEKLADVTDKDIRNHRDDLLRAAIVFLHASVEELLRGLAFVYLPSCSEEVLNRIPLAGSPDSLRAEKFFLGKLTHHRNITVEELINLSVEEHISRRSFSDTSEIAGFLSAVGFRIDESVRKCLSEMDALIARRHQIVHRADIRKGETYPAPIDSKDVREWVKSVESFHATVAALDVTRSFPDLGKGASPTDPKKN